MKRRWLGYVTLGVCAYLLFLIATIPASWVAWGLVIASQGAVVISQGTGTFWHGTGHLVVQPADTRGHNLGRAEWRINPLWLFVARLQAQVSATGPASELAAAVAITPRAIVLEQARASASAKLASKLYPPATLLAPEGRLRLLTDKLLLRQDGLQGDAQLFWEQAASGVSEVKPLGDYRVDLKGAGATASVKLSTLRGPLELVGQGRWQTTGSGAFQLSGFARAKARRDELQPLLALIGREQNGRYPFRLNARLPLPALPLPL
ncbi:MAG: type II secretion system protein N [Acidiferrobacterales bacterium]